MKRPTLGNDTRTRGEVSAWQHDLRLYDVPRLSDTLLPPFTASTLRALLTAAADARRYGDPGAADLLEHDALLAVRVTAARQQPREMGMTAPLDIGTINAVLAVCVSDLARDLAGEPTSRSRAEWRFRIKGSLSVMVAGPKRGSWHDHAAGTSGDPLGLVAHLRRNLMQAAYRWALAWLGEVSAHRHVAPSTKSVASFQAASEASGGAEPIRPLSARIHIAAPQMSSATPERLRAVPFRGLARALLVWHAELFSPSERSLLCEIHRARGTLSPRIVDKLEGMRTRANARMGAPDA